METLTSPPLIAREAFKFRPGTCDMNVFIDVVEKNEYRLPDAFEPEDVIIDVGGHIGSFAGACARRGAGQVLTFEACEANYLLLNQNLGLRAFQGHQAAIGEEGEIHSYLGAVWRSDQPEFHRAVRHTGPVYDEDAAEVNTGGGSVVKGVGEEIVETVPLIEALGWVDGPVRLLKLDCEGSEWPILYGLTNPERDLRRVEEVCGEWHTIPEGTEVDASAIDGLAQDGYAWSHVGLYDFFHDAGFAHVQMENLREDWSLGHFWARRA